MKRALLAGVAALGTLCPALAADIPPRAPPVYRAPVVAPPIIFSWTGCHIGINAGGHSGSDKITTSTTPGNFGPGEAAAYDAQSPTTLKPAGFIGGGQLGCNYQWGIGVFGIEADGQWLSGSASRRLNFALPVTPGNFMTNEIRNSWLATVRGRLGFAADRALFYATGGVAFGGFRTIDELSVVGGTVPSNVSTTHNRVGWTVGGGLEWAFGFNWSVRVEYLYVDLGKVSVSIPCRVAPCASATDTIVTHNYTDHIGRAALNFRF